ncbi:MAG: hypothetical protein U5L11_12210 [Arhodomonas sp.]|nr:hypothetical protein [Arhodomonas sp.]
MVTKSRRMHRAGPADIEGRAGKGRVGRVHGNVILRFALRFRLSRSRNGASHGAERVAEFIGVARGEILPTGVLGDAGQRARVGVAQAKAHHMRGEANTGPFERLGHGAWVAFTAFEPVGNKHHGRRRVSVGQRSGRLLDRVGQGCLAGRRDAVDPLEDPGPRVLSRRDEHLDVGAVAAAAMAVGHEPHLAGLGPVSQQVVHHVAGDLDLGGAVDLAPHGIRPVEHDHDVFVRRRGRKRAQQPDRKRCRGKSVSLPVHGPYPLQLYCPLRAPSVPVLDRDTFVISAVHH